MQEPHNPAGPERLTGPNTVPDPRTAAAGAEASQGFPGTASNESFKAPAGGVPAEPAAAPAAKRSSAAAAGLGKAMRATPAVAAKLGSGAVKVGAGAAKASVGAAKLGAGLAGDNRARLAVGLSCVFLATAVTTHKLRGPRRPTGSDPAAAAPASPAPPLSIRAGDDAPLPDDEPDGAPGPGLSEPHPAQSPALADASSPASAPEGDGGAARAGIPPIETVAAPEVEPIRQTAAAVEPPPLAGDGPAPAGLAGLAAAPLDRAGQGIGSSTTSVEPPSLADSPTDSLSGPTITAPAYGPTPEPPALAGDAPAPGAGAAPNLLLAPASGPAPDAPGLAAAPSPPALQPTPDAAPTHPGLPAAEAATAGAAMAATVAPDQLRLSPTPESAPAPPPTVAAPAVAASAPAAPAAAAEAEVVGGRLDPVTHVVQRGENFWTISRRYYGTGRFYKALWQANLERVPRIDELYIGTSILIPAPEDLDRAHIEAARPAVAPAAGSSSLAAPAARDDQARRVSQTPAAAGTRRRAVPQGEQPLILPEGAALAPRAPIRSAGDTRVDDPAPRRPSLRMSSRVHVVQPYETLRSIAKKELGDSERARELYDLNADLIDDPARLPVGESLRLPDGPARR